MANLYTKKSEQLNKALNTIYYSLVGYIEDSAGAESEEAKNIDEAFNIVNKEACVDTHDIGMIASVMAHEMFDKIHEQSSEGVMAVHDLISVWAKQFHEKFEGKLNWGEGDYKAFGFKKSGCWDEAIIEFVEQKLN